MKEEFYVIQWETNKVHKIDKETYDGDGEKREGWDLNDLFVMIATPQITGPLKGKSQPMAYCRFWLHEDNTYKPVNFCVGAREIEWLTLLFFKDLFPKSIIKWFSSRKMMENL